MRYRTFPIRKAPVLWVAEAGFPGWREPDLPYSTPPIGAVPCRSEPERAGFRAFKLYAHISTTLKSLHYIGLDASCMKGVRTRGLPRVLSRAHTGRCPIPSLTLPFLCVHPTLLLPW